MKEKHDHISSMERPADALKDRIHDDQNGLDYILVGDYYLPDIRIESPNNKEHSVKGRVSRPLGKWARMHLDYLENTKRTLLTELTLSGKLHDYLTELDEQAAERFSLITEQLAKAEGVTEELKKLDQLGWVKTMNSIRHRAEEIILSELIYV